MVSLILWVLAFYFVGLMLPGPFLLAKIGVKNYAGARDNLPEPDMVQARARRAQENFKESLPIFLALAMLALIVPAVAMAQAVLGAQVFLIARLVYLPVYMSGVAWLRPIIWSVSIIGLFMMALALI